MNAITRTEAQKLANDITDGIKSSDPKVVADATEAVNLALTNAKAHGVGKRFIEDVEDAMDMPNKSARAHSLAKMRTTSFRNDPETEVTASRLAHLLFQVSKKMNPWTPGGSKRVISKEDFKKMKVREGGHIPDGLSVKDAIAGGFLTADGKAIKGDPTPEPMAEAPTFTPEEQARFEAYLASQQNA